MPITPYLAHQAFEPEVIETMSAAFQAYGSYPADSFAIVGHLLLVCSRIMGNQGTQSSFPGMGRALGNLQARFAFMTTPCLGNARKKGDRH